MNVFRNLNYLLCFHQNEQLCILLNTTFLKALEAYFGLFFSALIAATVVPMSADVVLFGLLELGYNPFWLIIVATLGNTIGGLSSYLLGYLAKWKWITKYLGVKKEKVYSLKTKVDKYGFLLAGFVWVPLIGDLFAVALGVFRTKWIPVLVFMTIGKAARFVLIYYLSTLVETCL